MRKQGLARSPSQNSNLRRSAEPYAGLRVNSLVNWSTVPKGPVIVASVGVVSCTGLASGGCVVDWQNRRSYIPRPGGQVCLILHVADSFGAG